MTKKEFGKCKNPLLLLSVVIAIGICTYGQGYLTKAVERIESLGLRSFLLISFVGIAGIVAYVFYIYKKVYRSWYLRVIAAILSLLCLDWIWLHGMTQSYSIWSLLLISIMFLFVDVCTYKKEELEKVKGSTLVFVRDTPTADIEERRKSMARTIVEAIRRDTRYNKDVDGSYVINIDGEYGTGKSSLLKYIKQDVLGEDDIMIEFFPWRYSSKDKIIEDFFSILSSALDAYFGTKFDKLLKQYVAALIKDCGAEKGYANLANELAFFVSSSNVFFSEIRSMLATLHKPVYIFLDDLDRLRSDEIWTVCYLIRDMANFPYLYFIVASDMAYVELTLGKALSGKEEAKGYLKKIINLNIPLLQANRESIMKLFIKGIEQSLTDKGIDEEKASRTIQSIEKSSTAKRIRKVFSEYREVKRFLSSLHLSLYAYPTREFKENINIFDFIWLEILKFEDPSLYKQLYTDSLQLLKPSNGRYILKDEVKDYFNKNTQSEFDDVIAKLIAEKNGEIYKKEIKDLSEVFVTANATTKDLVFTILKDLFYDANNKTDKNSVQYINSFDNYFYSEISEKNISLSEFLEIIQSPQKIYNNRIENDVLGKCKEASFYHNFSLLVQQSPETIKGNVIWWLKRLFDCVALDASHSASYQELLSEHSKITVILERDLSDTLFLFLASHIFNVADIENVANFIKGGTEYLSFKVYMFKLACRMIGHEYSYFKLEELEPISEVLFKNVVTYIENTPTAYYNRNVQDIIKDCRNNNGQIWNSCFQEYLSRHSCIVKYWALGVVMWDKGRGRFFIDDLFVDTIVGSPNDIVTYLDALSQYDKNISPLRKIIADGRLVQCRNIVDECPLLKETRYYEWHLGC